MFIGYTCTIINLSVLKVDNVVTACKNPKLKLSLFSATISEVVDDLAKSILKFPVDISVGDRYIFTFMEHVTKLNLQKLCRQYN